MHSTFATDRRPENAGDGRQRRTCRRQGGFIESCWIRFLYPWRGLADSRSLLWLAPFLRYPGSKQQTPRKKLWTGTKNEGQMRTFLKKQGTWAKYFGCKQWQLRQVYSLHKQNEFSWGWGLTLKLDDFCFPNKLVAIPCPSTSAFWSNFRLSIGTNFPTGPDDSLAMLGIKYDVFRKAGFDCDASGAGVAWVWQDHACAPIKPHHHQQTERSEATLRGVCSSLVFLSLFFPTSLDIINNTIHHVLIPLTQMRVCFGANQNPTAKMA